MTDNATFSCMISSTDIVEHKRARPFPLYSELYYKAESDFFLSAQLKCQKCLILKLNLFNRQRGAVLSEAWRSLSAAWRSGLERRFYDDHGRKVNSSTPNLVSRCCVLG